jgi:hypothetical protein
MIVKRKSRTMADIVLCITISGEFSGQQAIDAVFVRTELGQRRALKTYSPPPLYEASTGWRSKVVAQTIE